MTKQYYVYKVLPEALANKHKNCAVYDGVFCCVDSEETIRVTTTIELDDVAALDVDTGDTAAEIKADSEVTVPDTDIGTPLEDDKAEARRLERVAARKAARVALRVEVRKLARQKARKDARMAEAEAELANLKDDNHPMEAMVVSRAQGKHLFKAEVTEEI